MAVGKVVGRFPVIEDFVAVLDWMEQGSDEVTCEENIESKLRFDLKLCFWSLFGSARFVKQYIFL